MNRALLFAIGLVSTFCGNSFSANLVVTSNSDTGPGSLRQTITDAAPGDSISFAGAALPIINIQSELMIDKALTLNGPIRLVAGAKNRILRLSQAIVTLNNLSLEGGFAEDIGGAIYLTLSSVTATNCSFIGNHAISYGGAIYVTTFSAASIFSSTFESNGAQNGGAIWTSSNTRIENSTFANNSGRLGAAIFVGITQGNEVLINSSTFANNTATESASSIYYLEDASNVTLQNTIIADNGASGGNCAGPGAPKILSGKDSIGTDISKTCGSTISSATLADLRLGELAFNGGPTRTIALAPNSVAIDAGNSNLVGTYVRRDFDQRGEGFARIRPLNGAIDVGAIETNPSCNANQPPEIGACPDKVVIIDGFGPANVEYATPTVSGECPVKSVSCIPASGSLFPNGKTRVECTAIDEVENAATCSFTVTVAARASDQCECPADGNHVDDPNTLSVDTPAIANVNSNSATGCNALAQDKLSYDMLALIALTLFIAARRIFRPKIF